MFDDVQNIVPLLLRTDLPVSEEPADPGKHSVEDGLGAGGGGRLEAEMDQSQVSIETAGQSQLSIYLGWTMQQRHPSRLAACRR